MNKVILGIVGIIAIIGSFGVFKYTQIDNQIMSQTSSQIVSQTSSQTSNFSSASNSKEFDVNLVNTHNKIEDCWVSFDKKVYDITNYATMHPGGIRSVARYCGKSLDAISDSHNGGSFASNSMQNLLKKYFVGTLK
jgi:cytochrome b involved in lipid metabolism